MVAMLVNDDVSIAALGIAMEMAILKTPIPMEITLMFDSQCTWLDPLGERIGREVSDQVMSRCIISLHVTSPSPSSSILALTIALMLSMC